MTPGHVQLDTAWGIFTALIISGLFTAVAVKLYLKFYRGLGRPQTTAMTMILVSMITASIIMAIGGNLALSLGMVGALSIIRYRTAVKDMRDLAYLFWSIAIGLCCGAGSYRLAFIMTATISLVVLVLEWLRLHHPDAQEYILIVQLNSQGNSARFVQSVPLKLEAKSSIFSRLNGTQELTFVVHISRDQDRLELENAIKKFEGVEGYQLLSPNHEIQG